MAWNRERIYSNFEWSHLTKLGKSRVIQSSYVWLIIVPAVAKALAPLNMLGQDQVFEVFGTTLVVHVGLPFSWKVFYVSAVFLALSSLLYQIFCPRLIKDVDGNHHAAVGMEMTTVERYGVLMGLSHDDMFDDVFEPGILSPSFVWDHAETLSPFARGLCAVGYLIGLILIAWVIGQGVVSVVPLIF